MSWNSYVVVLFKSCGKPPFVKLIIGRKLRRSLWTSIGSSDILEGGKTLTPLLLIEIPALEKKRTKGSMDNWPLHRVEEQGCRFWTRAPHTVFLDRTMATGLGTLMGQ